MPVDLAVVLVLTGYLFAFGIAYEILGHFGVKDGETPDRFGAALFWPLTLVAAAAWCIAVGGMRVARFASRVRRSDIPQAKIRRRR